MRQLIALIALLFSSSPLFSQTPQDLAIPLQVAVGINPPGVLLSWPTPQASDILLRRRTKGQSGEGWVVLLEEAHTFKNGYYDTTALTAFNTYEYALERTTGLLKAYGYAHAALNAPVVDTRGKILVFIDSTTADQLGADLINFKNDLRGEGWTPVPFKTGNYTTVEWVKNQIVNSYNADPTQVKAVLLIGSVPVPYSGGTAWDNQPDHIGAWPCDAYYGDVDGLWTDDIVNIPNTTRLANRNVPGDGKFDQNTLPSAVELTVGRLDFRHLSPALFGLPPVELLRRYLFKNHRWRTGQFEVPNRAIVDDELGWSGGEAFAADGFRNAYPLMESSQVVSGDFLSSTNERYLLGFGAGANSIYTNAGGVGSAASFATDSVNIVFANFFGDYFGDWDYETNPLMPAALASKGSLLACGWAGRPHWLLQGLAIGESIGYCLKETQNAQYNDPYGHSNGESAANIALLGDPTLRAKIVKPATQLTAMSNCTQVNLHWTASPDPEVLGYIVYRAFDVSGPYTRMTPNAIAGTTWSDLNPVADTLFYSIRALKLETTPGGGHFYNSSTGVIQSVIFVPGTLPTILGLGGVLNCQVHSLTLGAHFQAGTTVEWFKPNGALLGGYIATEGGVYKVVATANNGCTAAAFATVTVDTFLPEINLPSAVTLNCLQPTLNYVLPADTSNTIYYTWNDTPLLPGDTISLLASSSLLTVSSSRNGCFKSYAVIVEDDFISPGAEASSDGNVLDCSHAFVQLYGNANVPNATYVWSSNGGEVIFEQNPVATLPGTYCLTVTNTNGCTSTHCVNVEAVQGAVGVQITANLGPCSTDSSHILSANVIGGNSPFQYIWSNGADAEATALAPNFSGEITVTVTDAHGCVGAASFFIAPALTFFAFKNNESVSGAADGSIDLTVAGGLPPYSYQWSNGSITEDLNGLTAGLYTVTCTDAAGCSLVLTISISTTVGTDALSLERGIRIFPNPANDVVGVYFREKEAVTIQLTDLAGRLVASRVGEESTFFFDTSLLNSGMYVLWIELPTGRTRYLVAVGH